jgi:glycine C-acetyltransferase
LRELEVELSAFHGRQDTLVFPTGFAANLGAIAALVRKTDAVLRDRFAHASIQEACRSSAARYNRVFAHNDMASLERRLQKADESGCSGKLIVTDGVFSMHGRVAPLPELVALAKRTGARLMIDDAHGAGVLGATGGGIEEHYGMPGSVDVMMGTLSKSFGCLGGYVTGSQDLIYYLRFFAPSSMFTTSLPAPLCAGITEAIRLVRDEPEHHARLWRNIRQFAPALGAAGFVVSPPDSAIVTIFVGSDALMFHLNRELFDAGIKCSSVSYPAVAKGHAILRMTLNANHTEADLSQAVDVLTGLGRKYGLLHRTEAELCELASRHEPDTAGAS